MGTLNPSDVKFMYNADIHFLFFFLYSISVWFMIGEIQTWKGVEDSSVQAGFFFNFLSLFKNIIWTNISCLFYIPNVAPFPVTPQECFYSIPSLLPLRKDSSTAPAPSPTHPPHALPFIQLLWGIILYRTMCILSHWVQTRQSSATYVLGSKYQLFGCCLSLCDLSRVQVSWYPWSF